MVKDHSTEEEKKMRVGMFISLLIFIYISKVAERSGSSTE